MKGRMTRGEQNLVLLQGLIPAGEKLYIWCYDAQGQPIASSCPAEERDLLEQGFRILGGLSRMLDLAAEADAFPRIIGSPVGMQWGLTRERDRDRELLFAVGPVFYTPPAEAELRRAAAPCIRSGKDAAWREELCGRLSEMPVMSYAVFARYFLTVHNTLTGRQLPLSALTEPHAGPDGPRKTPGARDRVKVYRAEKALLEMVRSGDINYYRALEVSSGISPGVPLKGKDPLRQMKTSIVVFTTLVSRAAMEGGLSPETAYALGDSYIQSAEDCRDSGELSALAHAMYHDFIYRVHELHANPDYSHAVRKCCDYIELSLDRKIRTSDLASLVGYTDYYLTEKFRAETGMSVSSYIRAAKVRRAKVLLETTELPVREIADRLAFNTPGYFIRSFKETTGMTPDSWRKRRGRETQPIPENKNQSADIPHGADGHIIES